MADYSSEDFTYATLIVEKLINGEPEGIELESEIVVSDVESDSNVFSEELSLLEEFNRETCRRLRGNAGRGS